MSDEEVEAPLHEEVAVRRGLRQKRKVNYDNPTPTASSDTMITIRVPPRGPTRTRLPRASKTNVEKIIIDSESESMDMDGLLDDSRSSDDNGNRMEDENGDLMSGSSEGSESETPFVGDSLVPLEIGEGAFAPVPFLEELSVVQAYRMKHRSARATDEALLARNLEVSLIPITSEDYPERILSHRLIPKNADDTLASPLKILHRVEDTPHWDEFDLLAYEYMLKYRNMSYRHCKWVKVSELMKDSMFKGKMKRYWKQVSLNAIDLNEPFNDAFTEVDRLVGARMHNDVLYYLVKWRALSYAECTWECAEDLGDDQAVADFVHRHRHVPSQMIARPQAHEFVSIEESPAFKDGNELRSYQLEGLNWLRFCWYNRTNSILADEMGLGKTVQSVSIINYLNTAYNMKGPFLVVAPLSTIQHWKREFCGWTNLNTIVYHGNQLSRDIIRSVEFNNIDENGSRLGYKFNVLITTYEILVTDISILSKIRWKYAVVDEAHRFKSSKSKALNCFKHLWVEQLLLLTGTPLQNNMNELFTLLNLLDKREFSSEEKFMARFGNLSSEAVGELHALLKPRLLRRLKEHVEKTIALKEELLVEVDMTKVQKQFYRAIYDKNVGFLRQGAKSSKNVPSLLNVAMELRKCCNHPFLINGAEASILNGVVMQDEAMNALVSSSGKMVLVDKLLAKLLAGHHRVLIFSQMVRVLDILEEYVAWKQYPYERIDGGVRGNDRQAAIDRYCAPDSDSFVFLLCTRAGGIGINLTAADTVIIYDSDWNPQNDLQAQARCHRIGQEKVVKVYRLITKNTYEKEMFEAASLKLGLDQAVLSKNSEKQGLDKKKIDNLLKRGAYGLLDEEDGQMEEQDIDQILQRATTIVHGENREQKQAMANFSKASFNTGVKSELDLDDPDFWEKVLPGAKDAPDPNLISGVRSRKGTTRFRETAYIDSVSESEDASSSHEEDYTSGWTPGERNAVKGMLTQFGWGRWKLIRQQGGLERWTEHEIELFARALMVVVLQFNNIAANQLDRVLAELDNSAVASIRVVEDDPNSTVLGLDLPVEETLADKAVTLKVSAAAVSDVVAMDTKDASKSTATSTTTTTTPAVVPDDGRKGLDKVQHMPFAQEQALRSDVFTNSIKNSASHILFKMRMAKKIGDTLRHRMALVKDIVETLAPPAEFGPDWSVDDDRVLLFAAYKYGYGAGDMYANDKRFPYAARFAPPPPKSPKGKVGRPPKKKTPVKTTTATTDTDKAPETPTSQDPTTTATSTTTNALQAPSASSSTVPPWPHPNHVNGRVKKVVRAIELQWEHMHKLPKKRMRIRSGDQEARRRAEEEKERKRREKREREEATWTKKERSQMMRAVMMFGPPYEMDDSLNWERFLKVSGLKKKNTTRVQQYYELLIAKSKIVIAEAKASGEDQKKKGNNDDKTKGKGGKKTPAAKKAKPKKPKPKPKPRPVSTYKGTRSSLSAPATPMPTGAPADALVATPTTPMTTATSTATTPATDTTLATTATSATTTPAPETPANGTVDALNDNNTNEDNNNNNVTENEDKTDEKGDSTIVPNTFGPDGDELVVEVTYPQAKKIMQRVDLFTHLRTVVLHEPDWRVRLNGARASSVLPPWWQLGTHDVALVQGFDKHGMNTDAIVEDPSLPFYPILVRVRRGEDVSLKPKVVAVDMPTTLPNGSHAPPPLSDVVKKKQKVCADTDVWDSSSDDETRAANAQNGTTAEQVSNVSNEAVDENTTTTTTTTTTTVDANTGNGDVNGDNADDAQPMDTNEDTNEDAVDEQSENKSDNSDDDNNDNDDNSEKSEKDENDENEEKNDDEKNHGDEQKKDGDEQKKGRKKLPPSSSELMGIPRETQIVSSVKALMRLALTIPRVKKRKDALSKKKSALGVDVGQKRLLHLDIRLTPEQRQELNFSPMKKAKTAPKKVRVRATPTRTMPKRGGSANSTPLATSAQSTPAPQVSTTITFGASALAATMNAETTPATMNGSETTCAAMETHVTTEEATATITATAMEVENENVGEGGGQSPPRESSVLME